MKKCNDENLKCVYLEIHTFILYFMWQIKYVFKLKHRTPPFFVKPFPLSHRMNNVVTNIMCHWLQHCSSFIISILLVSSKLAYKLRRNISFYLFYSFSSLYVTQKR